MAPDIIGVKPGSFQIDILCIIQIKDDRWAINRESRAAKTDRHYLGILELEIKFFSFRGPMLKGKSCCFLFLLSWGQGARSTLHAELFHQVHVHLHLSSYEGVFSDIVDKSASKHFF